MDPATVSAVTSDLPLAGNRLAKLRLAVTFTEKPNPVKYLVAAKPPSIVLPAQLTANTAAVLSALGLPVRWRDLFYAHIVSI